MTKDQKIKLGAEIWEEAGSFMQNVPSDGREERIKQLSELFPEKAAGIVDFVLVRITELEASATPDEAPLTFCSCGGDLVDTKACGVCMQSYCQECLSEDFQVCSICENNGFKLNSCLDKNGKEFYPGTWLKSEHSNTWVQVLQIAERFIYTDKLGMVDREDFVQAGWVVHGRVTPYRIDGTMCFDICKFTSGARIGSPYCHKECSSNSGSDTVQKWVICELYNKEHENGI